VIFVFMISKESLEKFKKLYKERFKEELSNDEALRKATRLLNLYRTVYHSPASCQFKKQINENESK